MKNMKTKVIDLDQKYILSSITFFRTTNGFRKKSKKVTFSIVSVILLT